MPSVKVMEQERADRFKAIGELTNSSFTLVFKVSIRIRNIVK